MFLAAMMPAVPVMAEQIKDEEPLKVQEELRPPTQKFNQAVLEKKVRDNLFKKEEKEEKVEAKKQ